MQKLKDSIFKHGILQALTVRELDNDKYELIAEEEGLKPFLSYIMNIRTISLDLSLFYGKD